MLANLFAIAKIPNKLSSALAGEQLLHLSLYVAILVSFAFLSFYLYPRYHEATMYPKPLYSYGRVP
jgi:hypothetical protein